MTGYHISIGYNPIHGPDYQSVLWENLKRTTRIVCDQTTEIEEEARRCGASEMCEDDACELTGYAENYNEPFGESGHPIKILEDKQEIMQLASTGCDLKYHVRRAFVRLLMKEMHAQHIEINLHVT